MKLKQLALIVAILGIDLGVAVMFSSMLPPNAYAVDKNPWTEVRTKDGKAVCTLYAICTEKLFPFEVSGKLYSYNVQTWRTETGCNVIVMAQEDKQTKEILINYQVDMTANQSHRFGVREKQVDIRCTRGKMSYRNATNMD